MKSHNRIRLFGDSMLIEFAATGETGSITLLSLDRDLRIAFEGGSVFAHLNADGPGMLIETFASEMLGRSAYQEIRAALRRHVRHCRMKNGLKKLTVWVVAPVVGLMLALSLNVAVTRGMVGGASGSAPLAAAPATAPAALPLQAPPKVEPKDIARAMSDGVKAGKFSIQLSPDSNPPLYIFADPACSYCRQLEPELEKLGKSHTIHLFPVSVIGGAASRTHLSALLCSPAADRKSAWKKLIAGETYSAPTCAAGDLAVQANDSIFNSLALPGTPTIINERGEQYTSDLPNTSAALTTWLAPAKR